MINTNEILSLRNKLERLRWESYINKESDDILSQMSLVSQSISDLLKQWHPENENNIFVRSNLLKLKIAQVPEIKDLFDYFDYEENIPAEIACKKTIELCQLRDYYSIEAGYSSYPHLVLLSEGFSGQINSYDSILNYIEEPTPLNLISLDSMDEYWRYYQDIAVDGIEYYDVDPNMLKDFTITLIDMLGEEKNRERLLIVVENQSISGVAFDLTKDDKIKSAGILLKPKGIHSFFVSAHEVGHALLYLNQPSNMCFLPIWLDETHAIYIENNSQLLKKAFCKYFDEKIAARLLSNRKIGKDMELRRFYASLLTEIDMWRISKQNSSLDSKIEAISKSFGTYYKTYLDTTFQNKLQWSLDTFRTIDPVYIHNYIIAEKLCVTIEDYLYSTDIDTIKKILSRL